MKIIMQSINLNAPVTCSKSILIAAKPSKIWSVLTDINRWPEWQTDITTATINDPLAPNNQFSWKSGGVKIKSVLHTVTPEQSFGWTGKTMGIYAIHNWQLKQQNNGTEVLVKESMDGLLASIFKKSFNQNLEKGMQKWLELLKLECEK